MATAVQPFLGTYAADGVHSWFDFSVLFSGSRYRGRFGDVSAVLSTRDGELSLAGAAWVESISIAEPAHFRERVLGPEFFDAADHPDVAFRSEAIRLDEEGTLLVEGELIVAGVAAPVIAGGTWSGPAESIGGAIRAGLELETVVDRRDFGFDWQMEVPTGDEVLGWDVTVEVGLALAAVRGEGVDDE